MIVGTYIPIHELRSYGADLSAIGYLAFGDETSYNDGRFRAVGLVTTTTERRLELSARLQGIIRQHGIRELKFSERRDRRQAAAARDVAQLALRRALSRELRIDILAWDTEDSRHRIQRRDDLRNLELMYRRLLAVVLGQRWSGAGPWGFHPDEHSAIRWDRVWLDAIDLSVESGMADFFRGTSDRSFEIEFIRPLSSVSDPLIQVVDLFAGLTVFSRKAFDQFRDWRDRSRGLETLFAQSVPEAQPFTKGDVAGFQLLHMVEQFVREARLPISLDRDCRLETRNPSCMVNFWWYRARREDDKAPVRASKGVS